MRKEEVKKLIRSYAEQNLKGVLPSNYKEGYVKRALNSKLWLELLNTLESYNRKLNKNSKILDIGCGFGSFLAACKKRHFCIGIDPDASMLKIAKLRKVEVVRGVGENLPFKEDRLNAVVMHSVIEHTKLPESVIDETWRVLKTGGTLLINAPNYISFSEGHYRVFWLPKFPKSLAKIYLKLRGRDSSFIEHINYITINQLLKMLKSFNILPNKHFQEMLKSPQKIPSNPYRRIAILFKKFKLLPVLEAIVKKIKPLSLYYTLGIVNPLTPYFSVAAIKPQKPQ